MSSKDNKKKKTSTARQLHLSWLAKLFSLFLFINLASLLFGMWAYLASVQNKSIFNVIFPKGIHRETITRDNVDGYGIIITLEDKDAGIVIYTSKGEVTSIVRSSDGVEETDITFLAKTVAEVFLFVLALEAFVLLWELLFGIYPIRRKLKALDEMAVLTKKLGDSQGIDESKVHNLEDAIAKINPVTKECLNSHDSELQGIENAINELLERTRESYRQQTRFVSDASHELRTPIAVIQGYANMLDRWGKDDEKVLDEGIEAIKNESEQMKLLVEQLLFLARGDSGRNKFNMENVKLNEVVREVYEESIMIDEKHSYRLKEDDKEVFVYGDAGMLKQTLRILLDNAAKYTIENETIKLGTGYDDNNRAFFYVQDNGIGMDGDEAVHAFERFYRADEARNSTIKGTGLGLSIAKWIVDQHNGFFTVLTRKDIGTRITVTFN